MRKVKLFIAMSLDGFIAKPNDDLSFLKVVERDGEDYGYTAFSETVDTVILGRKTFDWVADQIGTDHYDDGEKKIYVITRSQRENTDNITFYSGALSSLVNELKAEKGKDIYCDGGGQVVNSLLKDDLIDEIILSVIPILVGDGTRLFEKGRPEHDLFLDSVKHFDSGLVQMYYKRLRN